MLAELARRWRSLEDALDILRMWEEWPLSAELDSSLAAVVTKDETDDIVTNTARNRGSDVAACTHLVKPNPNMLRRSARNSDSLRKRGLACQTHPNWRTFSTEHERENFSSQESCYCTIEDYLNLDSSRYAALETECEEISSVSAQDLERQDHLANCNCKSTPVQLGSSWGPCSQSSTKGVSKAWKSGSTERRDDTIQRQTATPGGEDDEEGPDKKILCFWWPAQVPRSCS